MSRRVGILTGGGDAPGLNAVIRAFVKRGAGQLGWEIVGVEDSFDGLMDRPRRLQRLTPVSCQGLLHRGGTILGTTNRGDPFAFPGVDGPRDRRQELVEGFREEGLEGLVCIGGDGSQAIGLRVMEELGIPVIGVPKTIDNDLSATDHDLRLPVRSRRGHRGPGPPAHHRRIPRSGDVPGGHGARRRAHRAACRSWPVEPM